MSGGAEAYDRDVNNLEKNDGNEEGADDDSESAINRFIDDEVVDDDDDDGGGGGQHPPFLPSIEMGGMLPGASMRGLGGGAGQLGGMGDLLRGGVQMREKRLPLFKSATTTQPAIPSDQRSPQSRKSRLQQRAPKEEGPESCPISGFLLLLETQPTPAKASSLLLPD